MDIEKEYSGNKYRYICATCNRVEFNETNKDSKYWKCSECGEWNKKGSK